ncbi:MAG: glycoside hydrolase family 15 protein [Gammaproteobacteria bacterium]|jgi:pentatricopeptide repeat protein
MSDLDLAIIGNCQTAALVDRHGRIVWSCYPGFDGDPVFCDLLGGNGERQNGFFDVLLDDLESTEQSYLTNTPILETVLRDRHGGAVKIVDFAPRFRQFDRQFRPTTIVRYVEPLEGNPRVTIRLRPASEYGAETPTVTFGSNHIRYVGSQITLRLTTDASISHVLSERNFVLTRPLAFILGPDESMRDSVVTVSRRFYERTRDYWRAWVQTLSIPFEWQDAVIRAAITLKLCTFEDTGSVVAAMTTSIPEAAGTQRNWDYRFCWLRDSFFVVHALNRLGATNTMEAYLRYILDLAAATGGGALQPVYGIRGEAGLIERMIDSLPGYRDMGPVRVGNQAHEQIQHDVYGSVIMSATQFFFDRRLSITGSVDQFKLLEVLGQRAVDFHDQPDAGIWEYRGRARVHTFSSLMCWAGCDRLARIAAHLGLEERSRYWREHAEGIRAIILSRGWSKERNCFVDSFDGDDLDASMLLVHELGFLPADDPRFLGTIAAVERELLQDGHVFRYRSADDFGEPENAFNICTFWYINALADCGRTEEARSLFEDMLANRNSSGLLSEDLDPETGELWGNFPQTYSMVGIINAALRLSKPWEEAF